MGAAWAIVVVVALLAVGAVLLFGYRLRAIAGRVGSFECALRAGTRWVPGVAVYTHEALVWYDVVSLSRRPRHRWGRWDLMITGRVPRVATSHGRPVVEATCVHGAEEFRLAAEPAAFDGVVSWLEATPPGARSSGVL